MPTLSLPTLRKEARLETLGNNPYGGVVYFAIKFSWHLLNAGESPLREFRQVDGAIPTVN